MLRRILSISLILSLVLALGLSLAITKVLALTPTPVATATLTRTVTPVTCSPMPPTYYLSITPLTTTVNVGDQIVVRELTNVGIGVFYLSIYDNDTGAVQSATNPIFTPATPASQTPGGGQNGTDFTLTAVRAGSVTFKGSVSGEILVCGQGGTYYTYGGANGQSAPLTVGPVSPTITPTPTINGALPDLTVLSITETIVPNPTATLKANGCTSTNTGTRYAIVRFQNVGAGDAGTFVVDLNGSQQTVSGLAAGQISSVSFLAPTTTRTATVDATNLVAESNETNNSLTVIITPGPTTTGTVPATVCRTPTPTSKTITNTPTATPTITRTPSRTISPTITRTPTRTVTLGVTLTPTATIFVVEGCSPVTSVIAAPFTYDGAGTFCWQSSSLGSYINSWNTTSVNINGINLSNMYVPAASYPAKVGGYWYVGYSSSVAWGHFEAK